MYIKDLHIKNFKNIKDSSYRFNKINLLRGDNGVGKSSTLEALIFLLTNNLEGKLEEYINWGSKKFSLSTNFLDYNDKEYSYEVQYEKGSKRKLITEDDVYQQSDAVKKLSELINPNIAIYSNISLQGQSTQLLFEKPTARLEKFKFLFGIESLNKVIDKINLDIDELRISIKVLTSEIELLKDKSFNYFDEYEIEDYSKVQLMVEKLEVEKSLYEKQLSDYNKYLSDLEIYNSNLKKQSTLQENLASLSNEEELLFSKYESVLNFDKMVLQEDIINTKHKISEVQKQIDEQKEVEEKIRSLDTQIKYLELKSENIVVQRITPLSFTMDELESYEQELLTTTESYSILKNKVKAIETGECPECGAKYSSDSIEDNKRYLTDLKIKKDVLSDKIKEMKSQKEKYFEKIANNRLKTQEKVAIKDQVGLLKTSYKEYEGKINAEVNLEAVEDLSLSLKTLEDDLQLCLEYETLKNEVDKKVNSITNDIANLVINKPDLVEEPIKFNYEEFEKNKKDFYILKEKEENLKKIKEMNKKTREDERENVLLVDKKENTLYESTKKLSLCESARKLISKDFSSYLIDKGTEFIKNKMNEIFAKSYGKYNISLERDSKGVDFYYSSDEKNIPTTVSLASGYEKQALSVSFRMALSSLHNLGIFIFDEIDSDSSEQNSLKLYKTILSQQYSQLFIISHKDETKEYLSNVPFCSVFDF